MYFTLDAAGVPAGTQYVYTLSGVAAADILGGSLSGTVTVGATGKVIVPISLREDATTEGAETITMTVGSKSASVAINDTSLTPPPAAQTIVLNNEPEAKTGGAGDDIFRGTDKTLVLDKLDGGAQVNGDTLIYNDTTGGVNFNSLGLEMVGVEIVEARSIGEAKADTTTFADVTALKATFGTSATLTAAKTTDVTVAEGITGAITINGGKNIVVGDSTKDTDVTIGAATVGAGSVTINATKAGASSFAVDGGTDITINVSGTSGGADTITVGNGGATTDLPSGAVSITSAHTGVAATDVTLNAVTVKGGTSVSVTQTADSSKAAADTTGATLTQGAVTVTPSTKTTSVTVNQAAPVTEVVAVTAVAEKAATTKVTFKALAAGEFITLTGAANKSITFTAAKDLTAAQVAAAFANLTSGAKVGSAPASNGTYSNGTAGSIAAGFTTGAVTSVDSSNAYVTFSTATDADNVTAGLQAQAITGTSSGGNARVSVATSVDGIVKVDAVTGVLGVVGGAVVVNGEAAGKDAVTDVTLSGFGAASTVDSDVLANLTLANSNEDLTVTTASTGAVTVGLSAVGIKTNGAVLSIGTITGLTLNASTASYVDVTADDATAVTINATGNLDLTNSSFNAAKTITVTGAGAVTLDEDGGYNAVTAINASASTGGVDASAQTLGTAAVFTGGAGKDAVKLGATTKAQVMGDGDDTVTLTATLGSGGSVDGGDGAADTVKMSTSLADSYDADISIQSLVTNFERLTLTDANTAALTLNVSNLGFANYVTTAGTAGVVYTGAGTAATTAETFTFVYDGVSYTATLAGTDAAAFNTAVDGAVDADNNALGANKVTATLTNTGADLTLVADSSAHSLTAGVYNDSAADIAGTDQALTLSNLASGGTVVLTKDGAIVAAVKNASTGTADVLNVKADVAASNVDFGTLTVANVETINLSSSDTKADDNADGILTTAEALVEKATLTLTADKATTLTITGSADVALTLTGSSKIATLDASALTGALTVTSVNTTTAAAITGGSGNDVITGAGDSDVLNGGAGNDKLTAVGELTTLTGGTGKDTFVLNTPDTVNGYATITDLAAGDIIDTDAATFRTSKVTLAATAVFQDYANASVNAVAADGAAWFQFGGDTYLVVDSVAANSTSFTNGSDQIIKITGLVDLSTAVFNTTTGDLTIV